MLNCPRCASPNKVKSGMKDGRQRYKCKSCRYLFTVAQKSDTATPDQRRLALTLYLEGLGFRSIGRVSWGLVMWRSISGSKRLAMKSHRSSARRPKIVELDELHGYIGRIKKTTAGFGLLLIDLANASSMLSLEPGAL